MIFKALNDFIKIIFRDYSNKALFTLNIALKYFKNPFIFSFIWTIMTLEDLTHRRHRRCCKCLSQ